MNARSIWATTVYFFRWADHGDEAPRIIGHLYEVQKRETQNIASGIALSSKPERGLFESKFDLFESAHPGLRQLTSFIGNALCHAVSQENQGRVAPNQLRASVVESWFHITNDGGFHDSHRHHHCSWCGIYYMQAGDIEPPAPGGSARNGVNRFYSPIGLGGTFLDEGNAHLQNTDFDVIPEDGILMLFPSYLAHSALPYRGEQDRIAIAFNAQISRR
jgi:uncharacterized protein (TIGR02466 family)